MPIKISDLINKIAPLRILKNYMELRRSQWLKLEELREIQNRKLKALIKYSYENVEFYHERMKAHGLRPGNIRTADDLRKFPITLRSDIQKNFPARMTSRSVKNHRLELHRTSGSTDMPVTILSDSRTEAYRAALFARPFFECGLHVRDKMMRITTATPYVNWYEHLGFWAKAFLNPNESTESALRMLKEFRPDAIFGHSSYLWLLAREISRTQGHQDPILVFTTADMISPKMRDLVRSVFGEKVFDLYGCIEVERVAWECPEHEGYHLDIDSQVIEFMDGNDPVAPGERGQIILTCLYNYSMPLIRYEVGDVGRPSTIMCSCGRGLPMMSSIEGRVNDFLKRPDGSLMSPIALVGMDAIPGISQYRIVQKRIDVIYVELVTDGNNPEETKLKSEAYLKKALGEHVTVDIAVVEEIARENSGKIRVFRSLV